MYFAKMGVARIASALGHRELAESMRDEAATPHESFEQVFWSKELSIYISALDGQKQPCRVKTSNTGHCLFGGITSLARTTRRTNAYGRWLLYRMGNTYRARFGGHRLDVDSATGPVASSFASSRFLESVRNHVDLLFPSTEIQSSYEIPRASPASHALPRCSS